MLGIYSIGREVWRWRSEVCGGLGGSQDSIIAPTGSGEGRDRDCRDEEASVKEKGRRGKEEMEERWKSGRREWWQGPRMRWN